MQILFPDIRTYSEHHLKVDQLHTLYIEESGNPEGIPVLFVHGGPGRAAVNMIGVFLTPTDIELSYLINEALDALHLMQNWKAIPQKIW